ncbi:unnamed protein product, partial [Rotaria socialis]
MVTTNINSIMDAQPHLLAQGLSGRQQPSLPPPITTKKQRKKCHGNLKLQRFKKKCRKRGLTKEEIEKLIDQHNHTDK